MHIEDVLFTRKCIIPPSKLTYINSHLKAIADFSFFLLFQMNVQWISISHCKICFYKLEATEDYWCWRQYLKKFFFFFNFPGIALWILCSIIPMSRYTLSFYQATTRLSFFSHDSSIVIVEFINYLYFNYSAMSNNKNRAKRTAL